MSRQHERGGSKEHEVHVGLLLLLSLGGLGR